MNSGPPATAGAIAAAVASGQESALDVVEATLTTIAARDAEVNAFTRILPERARAQARAIDAARAAGESLPPLAGVPFAAKNLFDIEGCVTRAGAKLTEGNAPAVADADAVAALTAAGAVLVGALGMGEFAYDFTGENAHFGPCRNPHDLERMSGGSSSGSAAAVAAGMAPLTLGSDTNGSLRVPASLCGVFSLKPTYGRLSRGGTFPFVDSLDHVGPMARTVSDLALAYDALQAGPRRDHALRKRDGRPSHALLESVSRMRIGVARGWFEDQCGEAAIGRRDRVVDALRGEAEITDVTLPAVEAARAAAYLITNAESSAFHLPRLRQDAMAFDPDTRDRFLAGALLPAAWLVEAHRVRRWWTTTLAARLADFDALIVPATPVCAPRIGETTLTLGGATVPLRPSLGLFAQPFSCAGVPVTTVPVFEADEAPIGVQIVAAPWREERTLEVAARLERAGVAIAHPPAAGATRSAAA